MPPEDDGDFVEVAGEDDGGGGNSEFRLLPAFWFPPEGGGGIIELRPLVPPEDDGDFVEVAGEDDGGGGNSDFRLLPAFWFPPGGGGITELRPVELLEDGAGGKPGELELIFPLDDEGGIPGEPSLGGGGGIVELSVRLRLEFALLFADGDKRVDFDALDD